MSCACCTNAIETKVGSVSAGWEHFFNWLRVDDEKEKMDREAIRAAKAPAWNGR
jgi:copper chaperone CopZ